MKFRTAIVSLAFALPIAAAAQAAAGTQSQPPAHGGGGAAGMPMMMGEHMKKMQAQMEAIRTAKTPEERKRLMDEHMKSMQEHMASMGGMSGSPPADPAQRMRSMEMRMDMMQGMMEQMLQHQQATQGQGK